MSSMGRWWILTATIIGLSLETCQGQVNGGFTNWGPWTPCRPPCDIGYQWRYRECTNPPPSKLDCVGSRYEQRYCNAHPCQGLTDWEPWSQCSASCGIGSQYRVRKCTNPSPTNSGLDCSEGRKRDSRYCHPKPCPGFTNWNNWSPCTTSCGVGDQHRLGECKIGSSGCALELRYCNGTQCQENDKDWSLSECSAKCGGGTQRIRLGAVTMTEDCNTQDCK